MTIYQRSSVNTKLSIKEYRSITYENKNYRY